MVVFVVLYKMNLTLKSGMTVATHQYFHVVLFIVPNKLVLMLESVVKLKQISMTI